MAEVEQTIARLRKTRGQPAAADYLQARLLIQKKEWAQAAALLERTRPALAAQQAHADLIGQIDLCLGQCFLALEEPAAGGGGVPAASWPGTPTGRRPASAWARRSRCWAGWTTRWTTTQGGGGQPGAGQGLAGGRPAWRSCASCSRTTPTATGRRRKTPSTAAARELPPDATESRRADAAARRRSWRSRRHWDDAEKLLTDARAAHPDRVEFWTALANLAGRRDNNDPKRGAGDPRRGRGGAARPRGAARQPGRPPGRRRRSRTSPPSTPGEEGPRRPRAARTRRSCWPDWPRPRSGPADADEAVALLEELERTPGPPQRPAPAAGAVRPAAVRREARGAKTPGG